MAEGGRPVLALDLGGTKMLACLVDGAAVLDRAVIPTERDRGPDAWLGALRAATAGWDGRHDRLGAAVTGVIDEGLWSALSPGTLPVPGGFALEDALRRLWGVPALAVNDAQAAAWGEHRFGAGRGAPAGGGADLAFLTVSTGIGGGVVAGGRLLTGLAGHFGLIGAAGGTVEDRASGRAIAAAARRAGHDCDARTVFARAPDEAWAAAIVDEAAAQVAGLCRTIHLALDPAAVALGGGVGLAPTFIGRVRSHLAGLPARLAPRVVAARLGADAGVVGVADLARVAGQTPREDER